jgi:hypothetical protein
MRRWKFSQIKKLIVEIIILTVMLIEGVKFIRFVLGYDERPPTPPKIERPAIPAKPVESPPVGSALNRG